jgi:hypothetical protein
MNKLYNPDECGTFKMKFGFDQPKPYNHARDLAYKIKRYENKRRSKNPINTETSFKR